MQTACQWQMVKLVFQILQRPARRRAESCESDRSGSRSGPRDTSPGVRGTTPCRWHWLHIARDPQPLSRRSPHRFRCSQAPWSESSRPDSGGSASSTIPRTGPRRARPPAPQRGTGGRGARTPRPGAHTWCAFMRFQVAPPPSTDRECYCTPLTHAPEERYRCSRSTDFA